ncbi:hypothetical protein HMI54_010731 [Coelomomyces lativittatus]|nr:hypothetical protein HMI54_010731 [Coelomomyces lativittatus]
MTALHIKFINLPQFHDPQTKYCFHSYIADGLSSKVCAKIPEIHSMKPDLSYFLWLFSPTPTGLSLEQLSEWLKELHETKEKFHYYQVPFVGPFFRISIGQLKKELKVQIAIWNTHLIQELNTHFERLTVAMQDLESVTLKSLFRCQPKRDPTDWHLLHTLLKNKDQVLNQLEMWTVELQHWWQLCFDYSISMSDESMNVYWHVMGCARRLNHEYTFSTDLLEYAEKEYLTRLDIHDQCVRESVLEYCKELEQLTKVGEAKQIQEMVFRFQSLRGRAERLIQLFDTTTHIRTQLNFEEHQVEEKYREFHTVFNLYVQVWSLAQTIKDSLQLWRHTVFTELPVELIDTNLNQWQRDVQHWKSQFPSDAPILQLFLFLENDLKEFSEPWAVAAALANPHLQMRQWFQITKKTGLTAHDLEMLSLCFSFGFGV